MMMTRPRGHSNASVINGQALSTTQARIPISGGPTIASYRPLPDLILTKAEWRTIGKSMNWLGNEDMVNPDPEAKIEQMAHELAYERVKHSYLFNVLENESVDRKADELTGLIATLIEEWISREVSTEAERQNETNPL